MADTGTRTPGLNTPSPDTPRSGDDAGRRKRVNKTKKVRRVGNGVPAQQTDPEDPKGQEKLAEDRWRVMKISPLNRKGEDVPKWKAKVALWCEFEKVWNEYLRFFHSVKQSLREFSRGVELMQVYGSYFTKKKTDFGEIYNAGEELLKEFKNSADQNAETMVLPCIRALACFVKFLEWEDKKRFKGFDDSWRDIYHNRNLKFKEQWTLVLRHMIDFVQVWSLDEAIMTRYIQIKQDVSWPDVLAKVNAAQAAVQAAAKAAERASISAKTKISAKTNRARGMFRRHVTSELTEPHALERMRGLLGDI
jgi:hypothetical protein